MQCTSCGADSPQGQRFCGQCGQELTAACVACGTENPPGNRFCGSCGAALGGIVTDPVSGAPSVERRVVSVLFIDLVGFTSYSEGRDPEDVRDLITRYFDIAREVIDRFGGTVDKYIGDAVMAWWGATTSQEDDAERAVRAAMDLVERVTTLGEQEGIDGLSARAAVMTGEVSVGPGGNERGLLLGDLVNTTSRLQSLASPGSVYVGATTSALISSAIETLDRGSHSVKGKDDPVVAFEAVRVIGERGGRNRSAILEPPFTGRQAELRLLKDALHAAGREGRARFVSLIGQAGIGKSRLIWEFQKYTDGLVENVYWHEGRSPSYGDGLALWGLAEMIRRRAGIQETDDAATGAERLTDAVATFVPEPERGWVERRLAALLGISDDDVGERSELHAAARTFFEGIAANGTTVLVFEDLHWADGSLLEFIEELPDWSRNHPILVVTLARPDLLERRPDWGGGRRGFSSTYLGPLADDEMRELIVGAVPGLPGDATDRIVNAAGGVPLFAVEMLRMLLAEGRLVVDGAGVEVVGALDQIEVPTSVQAVVAARLDRLTQDERELARDAAVLGHSFTVDGLGVLRDESVDKLERRLGDLVRREILELVRDPRSPERGQYRWVQSVLREVAYGRIARDDRKDLHLRVARYFRSLDDPELAPVAAAHFVSASQVSGADPDLDAELVEAIELAMDRAAALHAYEQVISLADIAVSVVPLHVEVTLRERAAHAAAQIVDIETADRHVAAVRRIAEQTGELPTLHRAVALRGLIGNETLRSAEARGDLESHLAEHPDLSTDASLARAAIYLARARLLTGDFEGGSQLAERAIGAAERFGLTGDIADALVTLGTTISDSRSTQAEAILIGAIDIARRHGFTDTMIRGLINLGFSVPDADRAREVSREAFDEARRVADRNHATFVGRNLFYEHFYRLELDVAEAIVTDPVMSLEGPNLIGDVVMRADLAHLRGDEAAAEDLRRRAQDLLDDWSDEQLRVTVTGAAKVHEFHAGDVAGMVEFQRSQFEHSVYAHGGNLWWWVLGALWLRDREALAETEAVPPDLRNPAPSAGAVMIRRAGLAVLDGNIDEGVEIFDRYIDGAAEQGVLQIVLHSLVVFGSLLPPDDPRVDDYVTRARAIADDAGAVGLRRWIDSAVGS